MAEYLAGGWLARPAGGLLGDKSVHSFAVVFCKVFDERRLSLFLFG